MKGTRNIGIGIMVLFLLTVQDQLSAQSIVERNYKISPSIRSIHPAGSYWVAVENAHEFESWSKNILPKADLKPHYYLKNVFRISGLTAEELKTLTSSPNVKFIESTGRKAHPERELNSLDLSLNAVTTVHDRYPEINGEGLILSIKENPFDKRDIDFKGRIFEENSIPDSADSHASSMATIAAGGGNSSPRGKGVAWRSQVAYSSFKELLPDKTTTLKNSGISVQNHSYGVAIENYYGIESSEYDRQCVEYPEIVHVFSSGNSGDQAPPDGNYEGITGFANLTGQFKMAKNVLTVGAVDTLKTLGIQSSRGPAYDGRIKPELVAYGEGGTSEAAALVSGISALIQHAYQQQHDELPPSSLVRAALINAADDAGRPQVDYEFGFGHADALGSIEAVTHNRYFNSSLEEGEEKIFAIQIPATTPRLKVTLVWNDVASEPGAAKALVNDLDLSVAENSSGILYQPWILSAYPQIDSLKKTARRSEDHLNTIEQVTIDLPSPGNYSIHVNGYSIPQGTQSFSVVYEIEEATQWIFPVSSDKLLAGRSCYIRWSASHSAAPALVEWKSTTGDTWASIGEADLSAGYMKWQVPDLNGSAQLRMKTGNEVFLSDVFTVTRQLTLSVGFDCDDSALLYWRPEGASQFQVSKLGAQFMEEVTVSSDTFFIVDKTKEAAIHFAVAPVVANNIGLRSRTVDYSTSGAGCYVKSFLPRQLVTDSVILDLEIGTSFRVSRIILERQADDGFVTIQSMTPAGTHYVFYDPLPLPGNNVYRARVTLDDQKNIFSESETVIYATANDFALFPNPAPHGQPVQAVLTSETATFTVLNAAGQVQKISSDDGEIKLIDVTGLAPGLYFIKAQVDSGKRLTQKLVIR